MAKILVVDDEALITMWLEERLSRMGYSVTGMATSGEEAVDKARITRPDLVLMDIVMPGKMNGIEAAKIVAAELDIPVVFITAYADNAIIEKAKSIRSYGYIVKPFNELEVKAAIEVALFRKLTEVEQQKSINPAQGKIASGREARPVAQDGPAYFDLPELKTVILKDIFTDIVLFLYTDPVAKESIFKFSLDEGIKRGGRNLFAYSNSTLPKHFPKEIQKKKLYTHRIKRNEVFALQVILEKCMRSLQDGDTTNSLKVLIDFSETEQFDDILAIRKLLLSKKEIGIPVSGIIAMNIGKIDHTRIKTLAEGISKIIVSTGKETTLSFAHSTFPAESFSVVPQSIIDDVVKKSLEPVVLSFLDKPISGYDIVHEIHNRYKVFIPQARVYTILHDLLEKEYLEIRSSGRSKLYCPTEKGEKYISQKLNDFNLAFQHIMGGESGIKEGINDKKS
jgi:CheY-like chemotaxis protein/DNA-binding PadR family transcriptional regulator